MVGEVRRGGGLKCPMRYLFGPNLHLYYLGL